MIDTILKRRSVRKFTNQEVNDEAIETLLKAAMAAPSARNKQPWEFYIIKNKDLQNELKLTSKSTNYESPLMIIIAGNGQNALPEEGFTYWIQDCSAATQNLLLTATSMGLSTCWCGVHPISERLEYVRKVLNLEDHIIPMALIHVGYAEAEPEARTQYDKEKIHEFK